MSAPNSPTTLTSLVLGFYSPSRVSFHLIKITIFFIIYLCLLCRYDPRLAVEVP